MNALLGTRVFPRKATTCTAVLTELRDGAPRYVAALRGGRLREGALPAEDAHKVLGAVVSRKNEEAKKLERVSVWFPNRFARNGVVLVDTPGVNDPVEWRENLTIGELAHADAAIMLLDCRKPLTLSERNFLVEHVLEEGSRRVIFVANKVDGLSVAERDAVERRLRTELARIVPAPQVLLVSALHALKGRLEASSELYSASGFPELEAVLEEVLVRQGAALFFQMRVGRLRRLARTYLHDAEVDVEDSGLGHREVVAELEASERTLDTRRREYEAELQSARRRCRTLSGRTDPIAQRAWAEADAMLRSATRVSRCLDAFARGQEAGDAATRTLLAEARGAAASSAERGLRQLLASELRAVRQDMFVVARLEDFPETSMVVRVSTVQTQSEGDAVLIGLAAGALIGAMTGGFAWAVLGALGGGAAGSVAVDAWRAGAEDKIRRELRKASKDLRADMERRLRDAASRIMERELDEVEAAAKEQFEHDRARLESRRQSLVQRGRDAEAVAQEARQRQEMASRVCAEADRFQVPRLP